MFPGYEPCGDDVGGNTPIHLAVRARAAFATKALLSFALRIDCGLGVEDSIGMTPMQLAAVKGFMPFFDAIEAFFPQPFLQMAILASNGNRAPIVLNLPDEDAARQLPPKAKKSVVFKLAVANKRTAVVRWLSQFLRERPSSSSARAACHPAQPPSSPAATD